MLENLEPKSVFRYFEEICSIPHGSGNVDAISDYLVAFAKDHDLWVSQDELKNVIIIKEASKGKENRPAVILQGHMDMVAVKEAEADIDMTKDPLRLAVDGDYVYARQTSLGGDDGIAVAYGLALLADESISHPRIELVVTTEEEVGMDGALGIDLSPCEGMKMLNIDSEEEGQFVAACAGGIRINGKLPVNREKAEGKFLWKKVMLTDFAGGHSGTEIDKNSGNANVVMGWFLSELMKKVDIKLYALAGGTKDNAIPAEASAVIGIGGEGKNRSPEETEACRKRFEAVCHELETDMKKRFEKTDPHCKVIIEDFTQKDFSGGQESSCLKEEDCERVLAFFKEAPNGVQSMSRELEGLVQTSLNLGIVELTEEELQVTFSLRSSVAKEREELEEKVCSLIERYGGAASKSGAYPPWEYKKDSPLRDHMIRVYEKQYGKKPEVLSLHAGLECGVLAAKKPGLDCVSFGPDILDIHTTREKLSISSVQRVWDFLVEVIETL